MKFVKFFHRYEKNGGTVLQDKECIISAGSYILFYYPETKEFLQINEKIDTYPKAVNITMNEYMGRLGFFRACILTLKNFFGISHCGETTYKPEKEKEPENFEEFFEMVDFPDHDLRPPIIVGGVYNDEA